MCLISVTLSTKLTLDVMRFYLKHYLTKLINDYKDAVDANEVKKKKQRIEIYILKNK
jgi:hypothetical protein